MEECKTMHSALKVTAGVNKEGTLCAPRSPALNCGGGGGGGARKVPGLDSAKCRHHNNAS